MQADLFTDRLIHLMRDVFARETLTPERRARILARVTSNPSVQGMELWTSPAIPIDEPSVGAPIDEADPLWLFPELDAPVSPVGEVAYPLFSGSRT